MEQKRPEDIFAEALDYLWNGLGLEEKGWKWLKKGDFKKRTKNGLTYLIWFERAATTIWTMKPAMEMWRWDSAVPLNWGMTFSMPSIWNLLRAASVFGY